MLPILRSCHDSEDPVTHQMTLSVYLSPGQSGAYCENGKGAKITYRVNLLILKLKTEN